MRDDRVMSRFRGFLYHSISLFTAGALFLSMSVPVGAQQARPGGPAAAPKASTLIAIAGGSVHTGTGEILEQATVILQDGLVKEVRKGAAPSGAEVIDAGGGVVTPGFIDPLTSIGLVEISLEPSTRDDHQGGKDWIRAGFRAADGYNPASAIIGVTRAEGVTSTCVVPSGGLISGRSAWVDLQGDTAAEAIAMAETALHVRLDDMEDGGTATGVLRVREAFDDARVFVKSRAAWERNQSRAFAPSRLDLEALAMALDGKVKVVFHVDRAADILSALSMAKEFKLKPVIAGGAEAWKVAKELASAKVPVIVEPLLAGPTSFHTLGAREDNAAILDGAGVTVAISTKDTHDVRKLRQAAGNAVRAGLPHARAIRSITRNVAEAMGMEGRYGTLEPGKVANLVIWSADPLEIGTKVIAVFIRGKRVPLSNRQTALFEKYRRQNR